MSKRFLFCSLLLAVSNFIMYFSMYHSFYSLCFGRFNIIIIFLFILVSYYYYYYWTRIMIFLILFNFFLSFLFFFVWRYFSSYNYLAPLCSFLSFRYFFFLLFPISSSSSNFPLTNPSPSPYNTLSSIFYIFSSH